MSSAKQQYGNLISEVKNNLITHLKESIAEMFIKLDETLFEMAETADNNKDQTRYFELMRDTRTLKNNISSDFIDAITLYLRPFAETEAEKKKARKNSEDELSLVGQAEMEDMVLIKSMSGGVTGRFSETLSHLEARLEHLALRTPDIFYKNALHPVNIFQAFDDALGNNFDIINKKTLFKFFEEYVALKLDKIYDAVNNILIAADILPQIKLHAKKSSSARSSRHTSPNTTEQSESDISASGQNNPEQDMNQGGYAMTATPGHTHQGTPQTGTGSQARGRGSQGGGTTGYANSSSPQGQSGNHSSSGNADAAGGSAPVGYQHITAGMPASQIGEVVGGYLGGAPLMPPSADGTSEITEGSQFFPATTGQYYGHQEILNALSNVQHNPIFSNAETAQYDGEAIKQAVLSEIAKTSGGVVTKSINRIAEKTIDFIELIFDAIIDDDNISDTIKTLLLRLQIPVIKASMIDQEFFIYDDHPARVLLDKIAHVGIGVADRQDEIYGHLDKIVTTLVNEFELQADSFQIALDALEAFIEERDAEALKKEEEAQRQVLREHARNTVLKSLRTATRGKVLPETIHALVLKRWPTMMYNHYLKQGKENNEWVNIVDTLRSIINSVQPLKNTNDLDHLISNREDLIETTRSYLKRTNQSEEDIEQVIQNLIDIQQSLIDKADFSKMPESDEIETESPAEDNAVNATETVEEETQKLQLPSNIAPGMWFQVFNGEDKAQRRCKLSVVILEDQKLIFVNYQGQVILEKNLGDFLEEMTNGKSKVIMGHSVFDHALNSVVKNIQKH
ncbi:MAG: DUF1631 domain-containing protein [Gammaproteobacteria bacterium]|nr:DUF1631 domain-containing protein [Gammaproteobacteria bacterium]